MPAKEKAKHHYSGGSIIRFIYLYLISAISFIVFLIGAVNLVDIVIKTFVFQVDEYRK